jgi:prepilin-type N-terminal cleavage/methylation domain-containing protein
MKRAFTLIELLVVIAIIAILAAILFPVFAQAKTAAKKTAAISNQKQISLALIMYMGDYDDTYPRQDSCAPGALNPKLNTNTFNYPGVGCTASPFYYRVNHFSWQKYVMPYMKNLDLLDHPLRKKDAFNWDTNGQIFGSFALNLGFTGGSDTNAGTNLSKPFGNRVPFTGGNQSGIPDVARAAILLENTIGTSSHSPTITDDSQPSTSALTAWPLAVREYWRYKLMKGTATDCVAGTSGTEPDSQKIAAGGVVVGHADGSAKFYPAGKFLASTPTKAQYLNGGNYSFGNDCSNNSGNFGYMGTPNTKLDFPLWGLTP